MGGPGSRLGTGRRTTDWDRADVRIVLREGTAVLKVPTSALIRDGTCWAVYIAGDGRARRTVIDVGRVSGPEAEVRSGLSEGTTLIVQPSDLVDDGARIAERAGR